MDVDPPGPFLNAEGPATILYPAKEIDVLSLLIERPDHLMRLTLLFSDLSRFRTSQLALRQRAFGVKHRSRTTHFLHLLGVLILISSADANLGQTGSSQFVGTDSPTRFVVSRNELLTPQKALRATDRAREDLRHGRIEAAQKEVTHALSIAPQCALALDLQGGIYMLSGDYDKGADSFQRAIDSDPGLGAAYLGMGMSMIARGRYKEALIPLDRATALLPTAWLVYFEAALAHLGLGETEVAFKQAALADQFTGTDPYKRSGASYLRAMVYLKMRDSERSRAYLSETVARDPNGPYALLAKKRLEQIDAGHD